MKYLKVLLIAMAAIFTFGSAQAQVRVQIGGHPHHPVHRRVVVVHHRYHHPVHHTVVVVHH